jgi:hypothetical protein
MNRFFGCEVVAVLIGLLECGSCQLAGAETSRTTIISTAAKKLAEKKGFTGSVLVAESDTVLVDASFGFTSGHRL